MLGHGTGGTNSGKHETLKSFDLAGRELRDVPSYFTQMSSGSFSSWTEAGNIGFDVLSRFVPTFDYGNERLYLEPSPNAPVLGVNHSGLGVSKTGPNAFDVDLVRPGSPAQAAGIVAGDHIVAVDGRPANQLSRADFVTLVERRPGTPLRLIVEEKTGRKDVTLVRKIAPINPWRSSSASAIAASVLRAAPSASFRVSSMGASTSLIIELSRLKVALSVPSRSFPSRR